MNEQAIKLIHYLSWKMDCAREQEEQGVKLDVEKAQRHLAELTKMRDEKFEALGHAMPKRPIYDKRNKPKNCYKQDGSLSAHGMKWFALLESLKLPENTQGPVNVLTGYEPANPGSTPQIKEWLYSLGWQPETFKYERNKITGEEKKVPQIRYLKGHPQEGELCEEIVRLAAKDPAVEILDGLSKITHRLGFFEGMVSSHRGGYLRATSDGFTNTLRLKHRKPLANIPGVDKFYGEEIRSCIIAPEGMVLCGADMVSLEDTTKRHYMKPYDPDYVEEMQKPGFDPHLDLAAFAGAVTREQVEQHKNGNINLGSVRKSYKATNYSALYGVGAAKLSRSLGIPTKDAKALLEAYWSRNWSVKKVAEDQIVKVVGGHMWIKNPVSGFWHSLRADRDRLSTLNQSTGVYCFDTWLFYVRSLGVKIAMQFHDEEGHYVVAGKEEENTALLQQAIYLANKKLNLNVPLGIDVKYGHNYAETH